MKFAVLAALFAFAACAPRGAVECRVDYKGDEEIKRAYERNCGYANSPQNQAQKCYEWQQYIYENTQRVCE